MSKTNNNRPSAEGSSASTLKNLFLSEDQQEKEEFSQQTSDSSGDFSLKDYVANAADSYDPHDYSADENVTADMDAAAPEIPEEALAPKQDTPSSQSPQSMEAENDDGEVVFADTGAAGQTSAERDATGKGKIGGFFGKLRSGFGKVLNAMKQQPEAEETSEEPEPDDEVIVPEKDENEKSSSFKDRYRSSSEQPKKESKPPVKRGFLSRFSIEEYDDYNEDEGYITDYDDDILSRLLKKRIKPASGQEVQQMTAAEDNNMETESVPAVPAKEEGQQFPAQAAIETPDHIEENVLQSAEPIEITPVKEESFTDVPKAKEETVPSAEKERTVFVPRDSASETTAETSVTADAPALKEADNESKGLTAEITDQSGKALPENGALPVKPEDSKATQPPEKTVDEEIKRERDSDRQAAAAAVQSAPMASETNQREHRVGSGVPSEYKPPAKHVDLRAKKELPAFDIFAEFAKEQKGNSDKTAAKEKPVETPVAEVQTASVPEKTEAKNDSVEEKPEATGVNVNAFTPETAIQAPQTPVEVAPEPVLDASTETPEPDMRKMLEQETASITESSARTSEDYPKAFSFPVPFDSMPEETEKDASDSTETPAFAVTDTDNGSLDEDSSVYAAQTGQSIPPSAESDSESYSSGVQASKWGVRQELQTNSPDVSDNMIYKSGSDEEPKKAKDLTEAQVATVTYHYPGNDTFVVMAGKFTRTLRGEYEALRRIRREEEDKKKQQEAAAQAAENAKAAKPAKKSVPEPHSISLDKNRYRSEKVIKEPAQSKPEPANADTAVNNAPPVGRLRSILGHSDKKRSNGPVTDKNRTAAKGNTLQEMIKDVEPKVADLEEVREPETDDIGKKAEKRAEKHKAAKAKKEKSKIRLSEIFTNEEEFDPDEVVGKKAEPKPQLDDYTEESDAEAIKTEIATNLQSIFARTITLAATTVASIMLSLIAQCTALFSETVRNGWLWFAIISFIIFGISVIVARNPIINGLMPLRHFKGNSDTAVAVAAVAAAMQNITAIFTPDVFIDGSLFVYTPLVILGLLLNSLGKLLIITRTRYNFNFLVKPFPKYAGKIFTDRENAQLMTSELSIQSAIIGYMCHSKFMSNFLQLSYAPDPSEKLASRIAPWTTAFSALCGVAYGIIHQSFVGGLSSFALTACMSIPMICLVAVNIPMKRLCSNTLKSGAMITGYETVTQFADTNAIMIDSSQLYPAGSVTLSGMKSFKQSMLNDALLSGAAIMYKVNGTMTHVFENIVQCSRDQLPRVDNVFYEDGLGLSAWVRGRRVLIGNRDLLSYHKIDPPDIEVEERHRRMGNDVMYISVGGDLIAMFILSYKTTKNVANELHELEQNGVSFIVRTVDPNITRESLADRFGLFYRCITVLPTSLGTVCNNVTSKTEDRSRAYLVTRGKISSFAKAISGCIKMKSNVTISKILQCIGLVLGLVTITMISFVSGFEKLGCLEMLIYIGFWSVTSIIASTIRK